MGMARNISIITSTYEKGYFIFEKLAWLFSKDGLFFGTNKVILKNDSDFVCNKKDI